MLGPCESLVLITTSKPNLTSIGLIWQVQIIHYGGDPGKIVHFLNGEYTGEQRDIKQILSSVKSHLGDSDYNHFRQILTQGYPASLCYKSPRKLAMMKKGNQKNFNDNSETVKKTINKEDRYSQLIPIAQFFCLFSPFLHHNSQGMVIKPGKNPRIV